MRRYSVRRIISILSTIVLVILSGCHAPAPDYRYQTLSDGSQVEVIAMDSVQGRKDEARGTNGYIYRFRVTLLPNRPTLRCELEHYVKGQRARLPVARLDYRPKSKGPVDVTIIIKPMNSANLTTGQMKYFIRIADKEKTTTGSKIFRGLIVERLGARNLPASFGDRSFLVAANRDPKKESWHNTPEDDDAALLLHMTTLPQNPN